MRITESYEESREVGRLGESGSAEPIVLNGLIPSSPSVEYHQEIVTGSERLYELHDEWNEAASRSGNPLLQFEWFAACAQALCAPGDLRILIVRRGQKIVGIAPFALVKNSFLKKLELLGASVLCEPSALIYTDEESMRFLIDAIIGLREPIFLGRLRCDSPEYNYFVEKAKSSLFIELKTSSASPWISIQSSWKDYEASISSSRRSSLRRARRQVEKLGTVSTEIISPAPGQLEGYLQEVFDVESANWKGKEGTSIQTAAPLRKFFQSYAKFALDVGILRLCFLRIDGKPISVQIALEFGHRFWVLKIGYDETYSKCSPGNLLMHDVIRHAFDRQCASFEFLGSDEPWLHIWTERIHSLSSLRLYPPTIPSIAQLGADTIKFLSNRIPKKQVNLSHE